MAPFTANVKRDERDVGHGIAQAILAAAVNITDCTSSIEGTGVMPELPNEILCIIFDHVLSEMRTSKRSAAAVCALMHTSLFTRARMMQAFKPPSLNVVSSGDKEHPEALGSWMEPFCAYFADALRSHMAGELVRAPQLPSSFDPVTTDAVPKPDIVEFFIDTFGGLARMGKSTLWMSQTRRTPEQPLIALDASTALQDALNQAMSCLRKLSPFIRARTGRLGSGHLKCRIQLSSKLSTGAYHKTPGMLKLRRTWAVGEPEHTSKVAERPAVLIEVCSFDSDSTQG